MRNDRHYPGSSASAAYRPTAAPWRVDVVKLGLLGGAVALIAYDASVSYEGFIQLGIPGRGPLVLAGMILLTQLGVGVLHALGESFTEISSAGGQGEDLLNPVWRWVLFSIYAIDIGSNAIAWGIRSHLSTVMVDPVNSLGNAALILGLGAFIAFADEALFRLHDMIAISSRKNAMVAKRHASNVKAHNLYLKAQDEQLQEKARNAGLQDNAQFTFGEKL